MRFFQTLSSLIFEQTLDFKVETNPLEIQKQGFKIYAGASSNSKLINIALKAKEDNDLLSRKYLAKLISDGARPIHIRPIPVVPIPSRRQANFVRGIKHTTELVREVSRIEQIEVFDILSHRKKVKDQSGLNAAARFENLEGAFEILKKNVPREVFILDDMVTTGATIKAAATALKVRNIQVLGVITAFASA
jgi:predicted amidophosphoribosyltransferase